MVGLYSVIQEMGIFPMSVANNFCDMPLPKYLDLKTVLIYRPHPVVTVYTSPAGRLIDDECSGENVKQMLGVDGQSAKYDDSQKRYRLTTMMPWTCPQPVFLVSDAKAISTVIRSLNIMLNCGQFSDSANSGSVNAR